MALNLPISGAGLRLKCLKRRCMPLKQRLDALILKAAAIHPLPAWKRSSRSIGRTLRVCILSALLCTLLGLIGTAPAYYYAGMLALLLMLPLLRHALKLCAETDYFRSHTKLPPLSQHALLQLFATHQPTATAIQTCQQALQLGIARDGLCQPNFWEHEGVSLLDGLRHQVFLGEGFTWGTEHLNAFAQLFLPKEPSSFFNYPRSDVIHALGRDRLHPIFIKADDLTSHTIIFGTTGSGKSSLLLLLIEQAMLRRESVIILDPKSDRNMLKQIRRSAQRLGLGHKLEVLDLSGNGSTLHFNPLGRYLRVSEIADRLTTTLPGDGASMSFKAYAQSAISAAASLLALRGQPLTLEALRDITTVHTNFLKGLWYYLEEECRRINNTEVNVYWKRICGNLDTLHSAECSQNTVATAVNAAKAARNKQSNAAQDTAAPPKSAATKTKRTCKQKVSVDTLIKFYEWLCRKGYLQRKPAFYTVADITRMPADYYSKVTAVLKPLLNLLTADDLSNLLSSGSQDSTSLSDITAQHKILYVALSCLNDAVLGAKVGKLLIADLRALAGQINSQSSEEHRCTSHDSTRINVFIDEASEIVDESTVQLLNKGRSCGIAMTLATQSTADLRARLSDSGAQQVLANCNTIISLRLLDQESARTVASSFPEVPREEISYGISYYENQNTSLAYGGCKSVDYHTISLAPPALIADLRPLHYLARLADGRIIKGRIPHLDSSEKSAA